MFIRRKMLVALTLVGALLGAGVGALVTHSASTSNTTAANTTATTADANPVANQTAKTPDQIATQNSTQFKTSEEQTAYRQGFDEGYQGCVSAQNNGTSSSSRTVTSYGAPVRRYSHGRVYYDYNSAPRGRTFSQKHRDELTLGIGTGLGAAIGGNARGGKGAGIGARAGVGGSALYPSKLRHRHHPPYSGTSTV